MRYVLWHIIVTIRTGSCLLYEKRLLAVSFSHSAATLRVKLSSLMWHFEYKGGFFMQKNILKTKMLVTLAVLIALNIIIVRFLSIQTQAIRIGFGFLTTALSAMLYGPYAAGMSAFLADFLGMIVNSRGMAYFPGFGINEALYGLTFGWFLYKKEKNYKNIVLCITLQTIFIDICLGSLWVHMLFGTPLSAVFISRGLNAIVSYPIKIFGTKYIWKYIGNKIWQRNLL